MKIYIPLLAIFISYHPQSFWIQAVVTQVLDADTVMIKRSEFAKCEKVRLVYIDAPELEQGELAIKGTHFLRENIKEKKVSVRIVGRGYYGRLLAELFYQGRSINLELVELGHAFLYPWSHFLNSRDKLNYIKVRDRSKINQLGIWSKPIQKPWLYRKMKKKKKKKKRNKNKF